MERSKMQCGNCIHYFSNQVGELKGLMIMNQLKCTRGENCNAEERCTQYRSIKKPAVYEEKEQKGRGKRKKPFRYSSLRPKLANEHKREGGF